MCCRPTINVIYFVILVLNAHCDIVPGFSDSASILDEVYAICSESECVIVLQHMLDYINTNIHLVKHKNRQKLKVNYCTLRLELTADIKY